ncbi:hypothetical protein SOCE26_097720 [Sorangium cellulosum]|uniref:Uncharacterized protein n=1 Tax=Sorangium cellulosum TaxID=56 RepID=A0A2L0F9J2_SORCE|nr:DUF6782 family putative metallopeptidase [Sorangium cellulosum]AUX48240.1 hypothetical protein SOCE26_097720 [Sorangium cellulosum]
MIEHGPAAAAAADEVHRGCRGHRERGLRGRAAAVMAAVAALAGPAVLAGCAQPAPPPGSARTPAASATASRGGAAAPEAHARGTAGEGKGQGKDAERAADPEVALALARVAKARGLPVRRDVPSRVLARSEILERVRAHVEREIPEGVLDHQGEALAALELIPADYDFTAGMYRLLEGRIAGFYEPEDATMYLVDDLSEDEAHETLAHELVHALQDQSFSLGTLLEFKAGDSDRLAAVHALVEGDAMSAMFDVLVGSAFQVDESMLRKLVAMSTALSSVGDTPIVLQESLGAPYTDGFAFVQALRRTGGWPAVDAVWHALPDTTEQLLHPEKLAAREPALAVAVPTAAALGPGFRVVFDDVMGEQALRIAFAAYAHREAAIGAAAGWGGDRFVVVRRDDPEDKSRRELALAWRLRFDSAGDAAEAGRLIERRFGKGCRMREALGPIAWTARGSEVAVVAGPYERRGGGGAGGVKAAGTCAGAKTWLAEVMAGAAAGATGTGEGKGRGK